MNKNVSFEKTGFLILLLSIVASMFNYLFQIIAGRFLASDDYGMLNALFSFMNVVSVLGTAMGISIAIYIAQNGMISKKNLIRILKTLFILSIPIFVILTFFANIIVQCGFQSSLIVAFTALIISFSSVFSGILQGQKKFLQLGFFNIIQPIFKTVIGSISLYFGIRYQCIFFVIIFGAIIASIYAYLIIKKMFNEADEHDGKTTTEIYKYFVFTFLTTICLTVFNNIDILCAKYFFEANIVGIYSIASLFGKIVLYIPSALTTIMLPTVASNEACKRVILFKTLIYSFGISAFAGMMFYLFKDFIISILFGTTYISATNFVLPVCIMMLSLVCVTVLMNYFVITDKKWFATISGIVTIIIMLITISIIHQSLVGIIYIITVFYAILCTVLLIKILVMKGG